MQFVDEVFYDVHITRPCDSLCHDVYAVMSRYVRYVMCTLLESLIHIDISASWAT